MTNTRRLLRPLILAASLAMAAPLVSQASPGPDGEGVWNRQGMHQQHGSQNHQCHRGGDNFFRHLNLTEAQKDKIFEIRHNAAPALRTKGKEVRAANQELRKLGTADQFDEARATTLANQAARAQAEFTVMRLRVSNEIYKVLTPEQRKQAEQGRMRHFEHNKDGKGGKGEPGPRPAPQPK